MEVSEPGSGGFIVRGQVGKVNGKSGELSTTHSLDGRTVTTLTSIGRDDPTTAEAQRAAAILHILQGAHKLLDDSPWIKNIWFPNDDGLLAWPKEWSYNHKSHPLSHSAVGSLNGNPVRHNLNPSQQEAVNTMFSFLDPHRITIIQGPPGTGKTSVIASFVQYAIEGSVDGIWLVAQSNVAVKNIAEKLMDVGFLDWKLLVSKDFHYEWFVPFTIISLPFSFIIGMNIFMPK
jgi:regulator of nonsense transcripts 1